jgi:hypothetical protein
MPKISFEITGDDKDLSAALDRMTRKLTQLEEANRKLAQQAKNAAQEAKNNAKSQSDMLEGVVTKATSLAAGYLSASTALRLLNNETERQNRLQDENARRVTGLAGAERGYLSNLGGSAAERQAAIAQLQQTARTRGVPLDQAYRSAGAALGFTSGGQGSKANQAFDVAARFNPYDTEQLTYGLLATERLTGSSDPLANLGFIKSVQDYSPIANTGQVAQNLIPGAAGVRLISGGTDIEAASVVNALSDVRVDVTGEESARTAQRLATAAKKVLPNMTLDQAIAAAQRDPRIAQRIADNIESGGTKAAAVSLLNDANSDAAKAYRASKAGIAAPGQRVARAEAAIAVNESTPVQAIGSLDRSLASSVESLAVGNTASQQAGVFRNRLDELAIQAGEGDLNSYTSAFFRGISQFFGADPLELQLGRARGLQSMAGRVQGGNPQAAAELGAVVSAIEALRSDLGRTNRQNATNDIPTHSEGR